MSVIMTLRVPGDPKAVERMAQEDPERMQRITGLAKSHGLIAHRFYGAPGQLLVIDEWPDAESFQRFSEEARSEIEPMMAEVGVTAEPEVTFWRELDSHDAFGWGAED